MSDTIMQDVITQYRQALADCQYKEAVANAQLRQQAKEITELRAEIGELKAGMEVVSDGSGHGNTD